MTEHVETGAELILSRIEQQSGRPLRAMIEVSDRCNEVCVHCYQEQGHKGEMSTAQLEKVIDELAELGVLVLTISGGEATLRKDFLEIVAHARKRGFAIRLFTNGLTMTDELAAELRALAVHVVEISVYSHRAQVHDFVTGVPGSFDRTVAGIRRLVALGVDVHIKTPTMSLNEGEVDEYIAFATELGATFAFDPGPLMAREGGDREPERWSRSDAAQVRMLRDPRLGARATGARPQKPLTATLCGAGENVHVEANGELRPCTMLEVPLGNAAREGVKAARVQSEALHALLALRWRDVHGCRDCDLRAYCGRCHASSLVEVGDALAPYPSGCASARGRYAAATGEAPRIEATAGRDPALGPYRERGGHVFETIDDTVRAEDDLLAARLPWLRRAGGGAPAPSEHARPDGLLQIRRPGRARSRLEHAPAPVGAEQERVVAEQDRTSWRHIAPHGAT